MSKDSRIEKLLEIQHSCHLQRKGEEWKMSFTLWTFIIVITGFIKLNFTEFSNFNIIFFIHIYGIIFLGYLAYMFFVNRANNVDKDFIKLYRKKLEKKSRIKVPKSLKRRARTQTKLGKLSWQLLQLIITIILMISSVLVIFNA